MKSKNTIILIRTSVIAVLFLIISFYAYGHLRSVINGVTVHADMIQDESSPIFTVSGKAKNATLITLNGREIFIDKSGNFTEKIALPDGYSVVSINAEDKFGKHSDKTFSVYKKQNDYVALEQHDITTN